MAAMDPEPCGNGAPQISAFVGPGAEVSGIVDPRTYSLGKRILVWLRVLHYGYGVARGSPARARRDRREHPDDHNKIVLTTALLPTPECRLLCETRQSLFTEGCESSCHWITGSVCQLDSVFVGTFSASG
jgi:hypothetical protein